jgi:GDP-L-fucose synthase
MFYRDRLCLVTGGTGFIGTHLVHALLEAGSRVRITRHLRASQIIDSRIETVEADLTRLEDCLSAMRGVSCVFHAAGAVAGAGNTPDWAINAIADNLVLTARVVQAAWSTGVERLQLFSSSTGYPDSPEPMSEDMFWNGPIHPAYQGYGWMRRYFERLAEFAAAKKPALGIALVRPTAVYGPHDNFDPTLSHVIPSLIRKAVERMDPYEVWGDGNEVRDFLHAADLAQGCLQALEHHAVCDPVNIGYGEGVTVKEVVAMVLKAANHENARVCFDASKPSTIPKRQVSIDKARRLFGFTPRFTLEQGIKDTVDWYTKQRTV